MRQRPSALMSVTGYVTLTVISGTATGCVEGQPPLTGYDMWLLWSGESRLMPSQHCGNITVAQIVMPVGQLVGTFCVCPPVPLAGSMQVKQPGPRSPNA